MKKLIIIVFIFQTMVLDAQNRANSDYAYYLLKFCINKNKIYPKGMYDASFFDSVSLNVVPICKIESDSLIIDTVSVPYIILISKNKNYVGVISSDDKGNSYIDVDYNYRYNGALKKMWPIYCLMQSGVDIYNMKGIDDQIVFIYYKHKIRYLDINFADLDKNRDSTISISLFKSYDYDSIPKCGLMPRKSDQNRRKNLKYAIGRIKY